MSSIREIAEREAAEAEAESPDTGEPEPAEGEPEPEPESEPAGDPEQGDADPEAAAPPAVSPLSEREIEQRIGKLEREAKRHADRVFEITAGDVPLFACPTCSATPFVGFVLDAPAPEVPLETAPDREPCGTCKGLGQVKSGSKRPGYDVIDCSACGGWGHVQKSAPAVPVTLAAAPQHTDPEVQRLRDAGYTIIEPFTPAPAVS